MIKRNPLCKVCKAITNNRNIAQEIYNTLPYTRNSPKPGMTLKDYFQHRKPMMTPETEFSYESLLRHVKSHQYMNEEDLKDRDLRKLARSAERKMILDATSAKQVWDTVIEKGLKNLQNGNSKVEISHLLKAAKDRSDSDFKRKDQQIAMMDMVYHFASGEDRPKGFRTEDELIERNTDGIIEGEIVKREGEVVTQGATDDLERRQAQSRDFYQSLARDAATSGSD